MINAMGISVDLLVKSSEAAAETAVRVYTSTRNFLQNLNLTPESSVLESHVFGKRYFVANRTVYITSRACFVFLSSDKAYVIPVGLKLLCQIQQVCYLLETFEVEGRMTFKVAKIMEDGQESETHQETSLNFLSAFYHITGSRCGKFVLQDINLQYMYRQRLEKLTQEQLEQDFPELKLEVEKYLATPLKNPLDVLDHTKLSAFKKDHELEQLCVDEHEECAICGLGKPNSRVTVLKCSHMFHSSCLRKWILVRRGKATCPFCRVAIDARRDDLKDVFCVVKPNLPVLTCGVETVVERNSSSREEVVN